MEALLPMETSWPRVTASSTKVALASWTFATWAPSNVLTLSKVAPEPIHSPAT